MTPIQVLFITLAFLAMSMTAATVVGLIVRLKTYLRAERVLGKLCDLGGRALVMAKDEAPEGMPPAQWKSILVDARELLGAVKGK